MKTARIKGEDYKDLDLKMAVLFNSPNAQNALDFARKIRSVELKLGESPKEKMDLVKTLYSDVISLHHAILVFETDPNLVSNNIMARIISGITPALLSFEDYLSKEDTKFWEILFDGAAVVSHWVSTTPYITGAKLLLDFRFSEELVKVEERLTNLFIAQGMDIDESVQKAGEFCDDLRQKNLGDYEKPGYIFLFWYCIVMVSYKNFKDHY
jgi:hypothetical protein